MSTQNKPEHVLLKERGNKYFAHDQYKKACECYSQAIMKQPSISTYYTNRALCHIRMKNFDMAISDCKQCLELDPTSIKGNFFMGHAQLELHHFDEALYRLCRAHELAMEQKKNFGDDITATIRHLKRRRFEEADAKRREQEIELQTYLERLIKEDCERRLESLSMDAHKQPQQSTESDIAGPSTSLSTASGCNDQQQQQECLQRDTKRRLAQVADLFAQVDERRKKREVPDHLCGKISFELMRDPVITPSGLTYERDALQEHLHRVGHFDPITRKPLTEEHLIPNLAMKEVVNIFLEENPWAEDF